MARGVDPFVDAVGLLGALGGSMAGLAALINVTRNHPGSPLTADQQAELDEIRERLEKFLTKEEGTVGQHRGPERRDTG